MREMNCELPGGCEYPNCCCLEREPEPPMTNSDRLQEIRERAEKATPELELKEIYPVAEIREMLDDNQVSGAWWVKSPTWIDLEDEGLFFTEPEATFYANA